LNQRDQNLRPKRRDRLYIIAEVLEIATEGTLKTQIMYGANLSFTQLNDYLRFTLNIGLLKKTRRDGRDVYETTEKGMAFLERYREITQLLKTDSGNNIKVPPPHLLKRN
jgi:predicted transcriptional regulator